MFVYILECADKTLYTGYAANLEKRIKTHNEGKGAKYTRGRLPVTLLYFEERETKSQAMKRESEIKRLNKAKKLELMESFYRKGG